ncbi:Universal stress protein family protein [Dyadobacter soli]|uniref:Universal stress protein family protein n=1 Tax=Dyadobacter soli TaxID=659014 RepID=A0A1G7M4H9_9BACT|nr:universal stress protein [Dyadobacter soli]SDF56655.1 Universal stress protein family protein [Dyadobacter soli]
MRKILVPTDFSENAEKALSFAIRIADKTKAQLLVLFVYHTYINDIALPEYIGSLEIYKELESSQEDSVHLVIWAKPQNCLACRL